MSATTSVVRTPSAATVAFLNRLGCTEIPATQTEASARIEQLLRERDTAKAGTDKQHAALGALGGRPLPGAIHREISKVIAVLSALEQLDALFVGAEPDGDTPEAKAMINLYRVCKEQFQQRVSGRVQARMQPGSDTQQ